MAQIQIKDALNTVQSVAKIDNTGQTARQNQLPVVLASEDIAVVSGLLTDTQLRATAVAVAVQSRTCLGTARLTIPSTAVTLASATGGIAIPGGAVAVEIQADGGTVRMRRDGVAPTVTVGYRLDDGLEKIVDSALANVQLIAQSSSCFANVAYFDRV